MNRLPGSRSAWLVVSIISLLAALVLVWYSFGGQFTFILPAHSPVNPQSIVAVSFLLLFLRRGVSAAPRVAEAPSISSRDGVCLAGIALAAMLAFLPTMNEPLLHDSYSHVFAAAREGWRDVLQKFYVHPTTGDFFFRPLGYLAFWLNFKWAGYESVRWHLASLLAHAANACLVYLLARQLSFVRQAALVTALVFAVHGARPEAVVWMAAFFDLLAAFCVLAGICLFLRFVRTERIAWASGSLFFAACGCFSKESAFCLPFVALAILPFVDRPLRRRAVKLTAVLFAITAAAFLYRLWVLGGVGGYRNASGRATVLQFSAIHALKGLLFRQWSFLFFPINWAAGGDAWIRLTVLGLLLTMAGYMVWARPERRLVLASAGVTLAAALPVQHLLLISQDMAGSRVLYLPVLGVALFWGILSGACGRKRVRSALIGGLLLFQSLALEHNLVIWRRVAWLSQRTCAALGTAMSRDRRRVVVRNLPSTWLGVYFLRNGFRECVQMNSHEAGNLIDQDNDNSAVRGDRRVFSWSDDKRRLVEKN